MSGQVHNNEVKTPGPILTEQMPGGGEPPTEPVVPEPAPEAPVSPPGPLNEQMPVPGGEPV